MCYLTDTSSSRNAHSFILPTLIIAIIAPNHLPPCATNGHKNHSSSKPIQSTGTAKMGLIKTFLVFSTLMARLIMEKASASAFAFGHFNIITNGQRAQQLYMIGTGFSFNDGEQILVSVQKPLGIVLEQDPTIKDAQITVAEIDQAGSAARAGVQEGDVLLAVQNMSMQSKDLEEVLGVIGNAPRVVNLRLLRAQ